METNVANTDPSTIVAAVSALERRVDLSVAIAELDREVDQRLQRLGRNMKMPGFRPGKVPTHIVRQQYGEQARHEALTEALGQKLSDEVTARQLRVAGSPKIEPRDSGSTTHIEFSAVFEVYPEITLGDLTGVEISRPVLEVGDAEIDGRSTFCASSECVTNSSIVRRRTLTA
jgi:trigger factor